MNSKCLPFHSPYYMYGCWTCSGRSVRQISTSEEWRSALVITGESMWSALACIGCMGKLQTPNGPLTHLDIPIISLLRHRFFTPPPSHSLPLWLVHNRDFFLFIFVLFLAWLYCVVGMMGGCLLMSNPRSLSPHRWMSLLLAIWAWQKTENKDIKGNPFTGETQICSKYYSCLAEVNRKLDSLDQRFHWTEASHCSNSEERKKKPCLWWPV